MSNQTAVMAAATEEPLAAMTEKYKEFATLLSIEAAIPLLVLNSISGVIAIYVHLLVLQMLKREKFSFSSELWVYISINIVCIPFLVLFHNGLANFMYPAAEVIGIEFCHVTQTFVTFNVQRFYVHSLVMALFKYMHTAQIECVTKFGANKVKIILSSISWVFPCVVTASVMIVKRDNDPIFWMSTCYGYNQTSADEDQPDDDFWSRAKTYACLSGTSNTRFGIADSTTAVLLQILCFICVVGGSIVLSNIPEAVLYYKLQGYINR